MGNVDVVMLLDESTSITPATWRDEIVPSLERSYIDRLDTEATRLSVIPIGDDYAMEVKLSFCPNGICPVAPGFDPDEAKKVLKPFMGGSTNTLKGLQLAVGEFQKLDSQVPQGSAKRIILLVTDGVSFYSEQKETEEYARWVHENLNVDFYGIGWGVELNEPLLKCMIGDPANKVDDDECQTKVFRSYFGSQYCKGGGVHPDLDRCLLDASQQHEYGVLIH